MDPSGYEMAKRFAGIFNVQITPPFLYFELLVRFYCFFSLATII